MKIDVTGKSALVTGSTSGIGMATARGLHEAGAKVIVNVRSEERVEAAIAELGGGPRLVGVAADVGSAKGCAHLVDREPVVDILVNNAGMVEAGPVFEMTDGDRERTWAVNVMSGIRLSRAYGPRMVERDWGRIVFVSSESALHVPAEMVPYGVSKLAQIGFSRGLAESVAGDGMTVNSVLPGPTATAAVRRYIESMDGIESIEEGERVLLERDRPSQLLRRIARPEEVANLIVYLCSPLASATTGAPVRVDGGHRAVGYINFGHRV